MSQVRETQKGTKDLIVKKKETNNQTKKTGSIKF